MPDRPTDGRTDGQTDIYVYYADGLAEGNPLAAKDALPLQRLVTYQRVASQETLPR